jgi:hypothetical protein
VKKPVLLALLFTALVFLMLASFLIGCSDLGGTQATSTTATSVAAATTVTSAPPPTAATNATVQTPTTSAPAPALVNTRYEEDDSRLTWEGPWTFTGGASDSGGSLRYTEDPASSVTVKFSGTAISLVSAAGLAVGEITLTLDSGNPFTVDCYSTTASHQATVWSSSPLDPGTHYLKVECAGTCNPASGGVGIYVDAFDVSGTLE